MNKWKLPRWVTDPFGVDDCLVNMDRYIEALELLLLMVNNSVTGERYCEIMDVDLGEYR